MQLPPVTGVTARFLGTGLTANTTTFYYWVQAIYPAGVAPLSAPGNTGAYCPAALTSGSFVDLNWNFAPGAVGFLVWRNTTGTTPGTGSTVIFIASAETGFKDDGSESLITTTPRMDGLFVAKAVYNFAVDGGLIGAIIPALSDTIPANAIAYGGMIFVSTALAGTSATISVGTTAGSSTTSLKAATAVATYATGAILPLVPIMTAGSAFQMTAAGQINITVATTNLTNGVMEIFVVYLLAANS